MISFDFVWFIIDFFCRNKLRANGIANKQLNNEDKKAWIKEIYIILILYLLWKNFIKYSISKSNLVNKPIIGKISIKDNKVNTR